MQFSSPILGAFELKRSYQRNMAIGFGISGAMHITAMAALVLFVFQTQEINTIGTDWPVADSIIIIPEHISDPIFTERVKTFEGKLPKAVDEFRPVPDDVAPIDADMPDQQELSVLAPDTPISDLGKGTEIDVYKILGNIESFIPSPDIFIPYDEAPAIVNQVIPVYPNVAGRAGIEGLVWIKAFIDNDGKVKDVVAAKASPPDVGFEEAAIDAAKKTVWKPAISNGQPIAVWVTYKVDFKLK